MNRKLLLLSIAIVVLGCSKPAEQTSSGTAAPPPSTTTQAAATSAPAPVPAPSTPAPATPSAGALASQETNWKGILAEVTEFRRKGNTLTAKVRLTNHGSEEAKAEVIYKDVYLIDTAAGKKYNVLRDEKDAFIASLVQGWTDRWYDSHLKPGDSYVLWMKFPAPPAETKAITLQIPNTPPFEDVNIQD
jgi:hypothetical protein